MPSLHKRQHITPVAADEKLASSSVPDMTESPPSSFVSKLFLGALFLFAYYSFLAGESPSYSFDRSRTETAERGESFKYSSEYNQDLNDNIDRAQAKAIGSSVGGTFKDTSNVKPSTKSNTKPGNERTIASAPPPPDTSPTQITITSSETISSPRGQKTGAFSLRAVLPDLNPQFAGVKTMERVVRSFSPSLDASRISLSKAQFDVTCPGESEGNPVCACQIRCANGSCGKAEGICQKKAGCVGIDKNDENNPTWGTLKRGPSDEEIKLFEWEKLTLSNEQEQSLFSEYDNEVEGKGARANVLDYVNLDTFAQSLQQFNSKNSDFCVGGPHDGYRAQSLVENNIKITQGLDVNEIKGKLKDIGERKIGVVALTYNTPVTLLNSMLSWDEMGLLDVSSERLLIANAGIPIEKALGKDFNFKVLEPRQIPDVKMNPSRDNVVTIGSAFYYALEEMKDSEYVIFLEKDFMADTTLTKEEFHKELLGAIVMLEQGAWIVRLRSRNQQGCDSFKSCGKAANWASTKPIERRKNHWSYYCDNFEGLDGVSECITTPGPKYRCHTSYNSNWSLNAVIVKREVMLHGKPTKKDGSFGWPKESIANYGLSTFDRQDGFEGDLIHFWGDYQVPICISVRGNFLHAELDG